MPKQTYLLTRIDESIDMFKDRFQYLVISHAQVLDLNFTMLRPVLWNLGDVWGQKGDTHRQRLVR